MLNDEDKEVAQALINKLSSGVYECKEIYGSLWKGVKNHTNFGVKFKATVVAGKLVGISLGERKSNNHQTYYVL